MSVKVFVLGRPGSGKTTAVRHIIELAHRRNYSALRMRDYDILYNMFLEDTEGKFRATEYDGFDVLDLSAFDIALEQLEKNVEAVLRLPERKDIITIEFARDDYREALKKFSSDFLRNSYFFYVDVDLETCIKRIHERIVIPPKPDYHFVSDYIMRSYYYKDNWDYMAYELKQEYGICKEVEALRNNGSLEEYIAAVSNFAEGIFADIIGESCQEYNEDNDKKIYGLDKITNEQKKKLPQTGPLGMDHANKKVAFSEV